MDKQIPYEIHPAAKVFPFMKDDELKELSEDIAKHGLREPIWLHESNGGTQLLDGRNRYIACEMAGIKPTFKWYDGEDLIDFIVSLNVRRRHLTVAERSNAALALVPMYEAEAKERQGTRTDLGKGNIRVDSTLKSEDERRSTSRAAKAVGASPDSVKKMKRLKENAPDLYKQVSEGKCSISAAIKELQLREKEIADEAKRAKQGPPSAKVVEEAKAAIRAAGGNPDAAEDVTDLSGHPDLVKGEECLSREEDFKSSLQYLNLVKELEDFTTKMIVRQRVFVEERTIRNVKEANDKLVQLMFAINEIILETGEMNESKPS